MKTQGETIACLSTPSWTDVVTGWKVAPQVGFVRRERPRTRIMLEPVYKRKHPRKRRLQVPRRIERGRNLMSTVFTGSSVRSGQEIEKEVCL